MTVSVALSCDDCGTQASAWMRQPTILAARADAARHGWEHRAVNGRPVDLCPGCRHGRYGGLK